MDTPGPWVACGRCGRDAFRIEERLDEPPAAAATGTEDRGPVGMFFVPGKEEGAVEGLVRDCCCLDELGGVRVGERERERERKWKRDRDRE